MEYIKPPRPAAADPAPTPLNRGQPCPGPAMSKDKSGQLAGGNGSKGDAPCQPSSRQGQQRAKAAMGKSREVNADGRQLPALPRQQTPKERALPSAY